MEMMKTGTSRRAGSARSLPQARKTTQERARKFRTVQPAKRKPRLFAGASKDTAWENDSDGRAAHHRPDAPSVAAKAEQSQAFAITGCFEALPGQLPHARIWIQAKCLAQSRARLGLPTLGRQYHSQTAPSLTVRRKRTHLRTKGRLGILHATQGQKGLATSKLESLHGRQASGHDLPARTIEVFN